MMQKFKRALLGAPRDFTDPKTYHKISLVALLAWVGLGADGLSSSAYGPEEAFRTLVDAHNQIYLAVALALATAVTVMIISIAYSRIIEHFPYGGGGYIVASHLLGPSMGVLSGSALLVDYVLTVSVSVASCADAAFSTLPPAMAHFKLVCEAVLIGLLVVLNLRGVKESIMILAPIFMVFLITHVILIFGGIGSHLGQVPQVVHEVKNGFHLGMGQLGLLGMLGLFMRAYSMGGGTYTGIEAVSNGLQIMREPKVQTGKRTMVYMSLSLAITAGGILVCYLLFRVMPETGKTMNAVLAEKFAGGWHLGSLRIGHGFVLMTLAAEAALLFVAAQTGFIDGPRVMANMALDGWLPRRYAALSDRLTMQDGVLLMGGAALATLLYTRGDITALVTMYSINVFLTFSLSEIGMVTFWIKERRKHANWKSQLPVHLIGLTMCFSILIVVVIEKFRQGAWLTLIITGILVWICFMIRRHYRGVTQNIRQLDTILAAMPGHLPSETPKPDPRQPVAVMLVSGYSGLGVHQLLQVQRMFPGQFKSYIFISVGVIDSATMKGVEEVDLTKQRTEEALKKYVELAQRLGFAADYRMCIDTEAVAASEKLCKAVHKEFSRAIFFMGKLIFQEERWYYRFLHNETAYQLQRRLHFDGINAVVLSVRLMTSEAGAGRGTPTPLGQPALAESAPE